MTITVIDNDAVSIQIDDITEVIVKYLPDNIVTNSLTEDLNINGNDIYGLVNPPAQDNSAASKGYVDDQIDAVTAGLATSHGVLTDLGEDDHPQYHNDTRGDLRYTAIAHASNTSNPHSVTAAQINAPTLTGTDTLSNKTITDLSNLVYGSQIVVKSEALENISKGQPVIVKSYDTSADRPEVEIANSATDICFGLAGEDITLGNTGAVVLVGILKDIDTSGLTANQWVYVNGDGLLSSTRPTTGYMFPVGLCTRVHASNGIIQVNSTYPLQQASDVRYDNTTSGLNADDVKDALDELASGYPRTNADITTSSTASLDKYISKVDASSGDITVTIPTAVGNDGEIIGLKRTDTSTNVVTITMTSSQTIDGESGDFTLDHWDYLRIMSDGSNWLII